MEPNIAPEGQGIGPVISASSAMPKPVRQQVFEAVRGAGVLPRVQIARDLLVSPASVTSATSDLIDAGLLYEIDLPQVREVVRGRPPVGLGVRPGSGHVAGLKVGDTGISGVVLDFAGQEIASRKAGETAPRILDLDELFDQICELFKDLLEATKLRPADISAVGIGMPGFVDHASGRVHWSPILSTRNADFAAPLSRRLGVDVVIDNDANLVTLAELWFGAGRTQSDFVVMTIEHGVGMGHVSGNALNRGAAGVGLELGHTKVQIDGALCRCGQRGCLEAYIADYALVREAMTVLGRLTTEDVRVGAVLMQLYEEAKAGNVAAEAIFRRAGRFVAMGIANIINLFDPPLVILSGERMEYDYLYASDILSGVEEMTIRTGRPAPEIKVNAWGDLVWARGAAALALDHVTDRLLGAESPLAAE